MCDTVVKIYYDENVWRIVRTTIIILQLDHIMKKSHCNAIVFKSYNIKN